MPTTTSAGDFMCWKRAFLKKSELNSDAQHRRMSKFDWRKVFASMSIACRVARRLDRPGRHLRLVGDEEVVQMAADEPGAGRLLHDDVDDVLAVEAALMAEERLSRRHRGLPGDTRTSRGSDRTAGAGSWSRRSSP